MMLQFNLRETSNIIGNLCRMTKEVHKQPLQVSDLWHAKRCQGQCAHHISQSTLCCHRHRRKCCAARLLVCLPLAASRTPTKL
jgi:hypothetical protein